MYRVRFAPSPTGPLHFGSLVAALASYLDARAAGGAWLVRMEDLDTPRNVPGAGEEILRTLERFGFTWDEPVVWQSGRIDLYQAALDRLRTAGLAYPCSCSRKGTGGGPYPGTCRNGPRDPGRPLSWRVRTDDEGGDFIVRRSDGIFAYQLAVVADDGAQGITDVVRGADLLDSTPRQMYLQRLLGLPCPHYLHVPVALNEAGEKLSKQNHAPPLDEANPARELREALRFLGQRDVDGAAPDEIIPQAIRNWNPDALRG
ncbi:MAG TPA: tRNA glutamyl-Q(34) synthetase GluQRS [Bryobacteraceae bacterium]|nr:tRNA glutamyl-Q(34) synthetase GluQRS [Bryobacteraceae bacterium]